MANEQNLRPFSSLSAEEAREIRSKGGKASGKVRVRKREFNAALVEALSTAMPNGVADEETEAVIKAMLKKNEIPSLQDGLIAVLFKIAISGDPRAVEAIKLILAQTGDGAPDKQEIVVKVDSSAGDIMG